MLTEAQKQARAGRLTASRVAVLMTGSEEEIHALWRQMAFGEPEPDLSDVWPVRLGEATEAVNLEFYQRQTGHILERFGQFVEHPLYDWLGCTLDAFDPELPGPVDAKHVGGYQARDLVVARYWPQMHVQMLCTLTTTSRLSIIEGAKLPVIEAIDFDRDYAAELMERCQAFWACVEAKTEPFALPPPVEPVLPEKWRTVDLRAETPNWGPDMEEQFDIWLANKEAADFHAKATKKVKELLPADVGTVLAEGVTVKRAKNGSVSIREMSNA